MYPCEFNFPRVRQGIHFTFEKDFSVEQERSISNQEHSPVIRQMVT